MRDQRHLVALDQQATLYLAVFAHLVDVLHVLDGLVVLNARLRATAVDLHRVKVAVADPARQESAADLGLGHQPVEVEVRKLTVAYLLSLVSMRHAFLKIPIEGLNLQILVHLGDIHPKSQFLVGLLPDLALYPQQAQQHITAEIAIVLLLGPELAAVLFDLKADYLSLGVFLPGRLIAEYGLLQFSDVMVEQLREICHLLEQRHGYPLAAVVQNHQSLRLLHLVEVQLPQVPKLRSKFRLPQVLAQHIQIYKHQASS